MASLEGAKVVVAGGAGGVGEGIVRALLKHGARVLVPSRSEEKLRGLQAYCQDVPTGELLPLVGDLGDEESARTLQSKIYEQFRELDLAVASLGGWWQGKPLTSVDMATWERILRENLTAHFLAVKMLVPLLHPKTGSYVHVNGFGAEQPFPMAGPVAMAAAAQKSMALTLAEELSPTGIRVYELILGPIQTRRRQGQGQKDWYTPEEVGEEIAGLVTQRNGEIVHRLLSKRDAWQVN
ncbi:MAG TPA: SDR family oxidoreductase [Thermoanaerobaculia bacterium]|jgi:NAD(P)-dependent dehydrogenase (short-subunit alcohol dehydrogenase family)|nr:SDR family oxidoreductase [Thermoanaerobaculia bacterium]